MPPAPRSKWSADKVTIIFGEELLTRIRVAAKENGLKKFVVEAVERELARRAQTDQKPCR